MVPVSTSRRNYMSFFIAPLCVMPKAVWRYSSKAMVLTLALAIALALALVLALALAVMSCVFLR